MEAEKPEKRNGAAPGSNNGGGRKPSIDLLKDKATKLAQAEFWVKMSKDKAIPRLMKMLENADDLVAWKAVKEILDRAEGKPKESVDVTSGGETLEATVIKIVSPNVGS